MRRPLRSAAFQITVRAALVAAALVLLSRASGGLIDFRQRYSESFSFELGPWIVWMVPAALAGAAFALAAAPASTPRFRWGVSLSVGFVAILLLAQFVYAFTEAISAGSTPSTSWLTRFYWYFDSGPQFVLAVLVGVALGLGFTGSRSARSDSDGAVEAS